MRGKRSKQYRKLMQQYNLHFGFREPYQVLLDGAIIENAAGFKMDFIGGLAKALHGQIKPMLTTCSIRHLATRNDQGSIVMTHARDFERRRCNHHELEKPLSEFECLKSVVDPKETKTNKHKLVVASQDDKLRTYLRGIPGVPLIYLKRSVMVMEPMAAATERVREAGERGKFRAGLKGSRTPGTAPPGSGLKRKRNDRDGGDDGSERDDSDEHTESHAMAEIKSTKKKKGPSGPNPLSVKKSKKAINPAANAGNAESPSNPGNADVAAKPKRRRKHKSAATNGSDVAFDAHTAVVVGS